MNCNYTLSTTLDLYFKQLNFVDVCAVRSGNTTRYYFNGIDKDTKELVIDTNNNYSISNVNNVSFNGFVYEYRDWNTMFGLVSAIVLLTFLFEKFLSYIFVSGGKIK